MTLTSKAIISTPLAPRYMAQLCKHFAHRLPVELNETTGRIEFQSGVCNLDANAELLTLRAEAIDPALLQDVEQVAGRHLVRFAFREELTLDWVRA